jgi:Immunity protein Imm1
MSKGGHISRPSWTDIEAAVKNLDGKKFTMVTVEGTGGAHLTIGGGTSGKYVVYATFDRIQFFTLATHGKGETKVPLFVGGQEGEYPENIVVDSTLALAAAKSFADFGRLDSNLFWLNR